jgi:hypothetical protein
MKRVLLFSVLSLAIFICCKKGDSTNNNRGQNSPSVTYGTKLSADGPGNTYELLSRCWEALQMKTLIVLIQPLEGISRKCSIMN